MIKKFILKEGKHYASPFFFLRRFLPSFKKHYYADVTFDESCLYKINGYDYADINKLFGVTRGFLVHHNSVRFGWRSLDDKTIQLVSYVYVNKVRIPETIIATVLPNETIHCSLILSGNRCIFKTDKDDSLSKIITIKKSWFGFRLWPYFGGPIPAPYAMLINLEFTKE